MKHFIGLPINTLIPEDDTGKNFIVYEPISFQKAFKEFCKNDVKAGEYLVGDVFKEMVDRHTVNMDNSSHCLYDLQLFEDLNRKPYFAGPVLQATSTIGYGYRFRVSINPETLHEQDLFFGMRSLTENTFEKADGDINVTVRKVERIIAYDVTRKNPYIHVNGRII